MAPTTDEQGGEPDEVFERRRTSFGAGAADYDRVRPEWPDRTVAWLLGSPAAGTVCRVVDLGAGTGKGTRALARLGHEVVAVEPAAGMRESLQRAVARLPATVATRVSLREGGAEDIPVPDGSVDAVTAFQAWHWFDHARASAEAARVLRSGGWLSMAWHRRREEEAWARELSAIVGRRENEPEDLHPPSLGPEFDPAQTEVFDHRVRQSLDDFVLHVSTWSYVAVHPERDRMLQEARALGRRVADADGTVTIPMTTLCHRARRR